MLGTANQEGQLPKLARAALQTIIQHTDARPAEPGAACQPGLLCSAADTLPSALHNQ
jgi:hypothetical protein